MFTTKEGIEVAIAVIFPYVGVILGGLIVQRNLDSWYYSLNQPTWTLPIWIFSVVWAVICFGIGIASYLAYREATSSAVNMSRDAIIALILYMVQMIFNWAWAPILFGFHSIKWSFIDRIALTLSAAACGIAFYRIKPVAGLILLPYVVWLVYVTSLSYALYTMNS